ncbi:MAG: hypothetical protein QXK57_01020 [Conexivisphaerales archaeon]
MLGDDRPALKGTDTQSISDIAHIQNDFSRRRKSLQKHNRQNCVNDALLL